MKPRLLTVLLLLVGLPLLLLVGMGVWLGREQAAIQEHRTRQLLEAALAEYDLAVGRLFEERRRELVELTTFETRDPEALREALRGEPRVIQFFILTPDERMYFPSAVFGLTGSESGFLQRSETVWQRGGVLQSPPQNRISSQSFVGNLDPGQAADVRTNFPVTNSNTLFNVSILDNTGMSTVPGAVDEDSSWGWHAWYWGHGTHLLFWRRMADGWVHGVELDRARLMGDVINRLPATRPEGGPEIEGRVVLRDANGEALYTWGPHEPAADEPPVAVRALGAPLQSWRLDYHLPARLIHADSRLIWLTLGAGLAASAAFLLLLGLDFYRESSREMREASQRVNFVNQVSHELKTPLTNIRLYAELMGERFDTEEDPKTRQYLDVIAHESQRLSRMIGNVLTFGRRGSDARKLHPEHCAPDAIVSRTLDHFRPAFEQKSLTLTTKLETGEPTDLDADALEQILSNLLGNVEKYAGDGGTVEVTSRLEGDEIVMTITDDGPGIPPAERERIFEPFHRIHSGLNEGVSGTGIGLTIARELAERHGGGLRLLPTGKGACFEVRLRPLSAAERMGS